MQTPSESAKRQEASYEIVAAERLNDGLVIKFKDGQCGFYSDAYLYSKLGECGRLDDQKIEW